MSLVSRRQSLACLAASAASALGLAPQPAQASAQAWTRVLEQARGQTVYFNAWGGAPTINAFIEWAGEQLLRRFEVRLVHVKVSEAADVVKRVRSEKAAGQADGSVDLVWINGENFLTMKREGLLFGPFAEQLPSFAYVDTAGKPTTRIDFSEPVDGMKHPGAWPSLHLWPTQSASPTLHVTCRLGSPLRLNTRGAARTRDRQTFMAPRSSSRCCWT
jgi:putative thiamine transport system substrate-binding protein